MSNWSAPVVSFASAMSAGATITGSTINYERVMAQHAMQMTLADVSDAGYVVFRLFGSLDGTNFYQLLQSVGYTLNGAAVATVTAPAQFVYATVEASDDTFSGSLSATVVALESS